VTDLRARETTPPDWDGIVVELVEEDRVVGIAYLEDGIAMAEFYPDEESEPWVFDVTDLQRVLDTAAAMLGVAPEGITGESSDADAVDRLAEQFDAAAEFRGEGDEGFYPVPVAVAIAAQAEALGLAVVSLEGFTLSDGAPAPVSGLHTDIADAHQGEAWPTFRAACNVQARALLERWVSRTGLVVAMEVGDSDGERYVL
jgi:hypothetical protein